MEVRWTEEQKEAITTRGKNILVAAAAGSGKTAVLVERIINIVTDPEKPVDIDRLLVVTFTNAAASEMRERIAERLISLLDDNPGDKRLADQLTLLNKATVTTIHSFCLDVVRKHFFLLDLDPNFRVGDDTETLLLKIEAVEE
ncbi:MAG: UvrD-helicase domain-containing protein, partial [Caldanaerobacter sp.]